MPPVTIASPCSTRVAASARALSKHALAGRRGTPAAAPRRKRRLLPAITCISGPPCRPGKTAELIFRPISASLARIMPPRGPRSVLCVVVVTTCACGSGLGNTPGGDQAGEVRHVHHEVGADLVGHLANAGEVDGARIGGAAGDDQLRPFGARQPFQFVVVEQSVLARARRNAPRGTTCPTGSAARRASGGRRRRGSCRGWCRQACSSARNTAWFACAPECGCTLANAQAKSCFARSIASRSATSTSAQPP